MISKIFKQVTILLSLIGLLILPYLVFAGTAATERMEDVGENSGFAEANETTLSSMAGEIVNAFLSLLGVIFIVLIIYAGIKWMTAGGNEDKVKEARTMITRAIIGLIIIVGSWAIWNFVFLNLFM